MWRGKLGMTRQASWAVDHIYCTTLGVRTAREPMGTTSCVETANGRKPENPFFYRAAGCARHAGLLSASDIQIT